jgi:hypothetical protein
VLNTVKDAPVWGGCSGTLYQLMPAAELEPGARYELSAAISEIGPERSSLVVGDTDTTFKAISRVDVTAILEELRPDLVGAALCGDPKLEGRPVNALLVVEARTPAEAPVILTSIVEDPVAGMFESVDVSLSPERVGRDLARIVFTLPAEANRCADVGVVDLDGLEVFSEMLCPEVSTPVTRSFEAELVAMPATTTDTRDVTPSGGCNMARPSRSSSSALAWLAAAVFALRRTRRRRCANRATPNGCKDRA